MNTNGATVAILLAVYANWALNAYSALNSSPQTTEINADKRADTLMKYVYIGDAVALGGGLIGSVVLGKVWPLLGAGMVVAAMHFLYVHAKNAGLANSDPGTED